MNDGGDGCSSMSLFLKHGTHAEALRFRREETGCSLSRMTKSIQLTRRSLSEGYVPNPCRCHRSDMDWKNTDPCLKCDDGLTKTKITT